MTAPEHWHVQSLRPEHPTLVRALTFLSRLVSLELLLLAGP